ncbi:PIG-L family deacetylase [Halorubrum sp. LN27]|uniref:PIG-L deacetylase family protein n=1 Tax=Halorubrum sp. LN27 TaxID=2801032 RepID=UPI00190B296B|nr:PIG-L family deacetylase [Halorubrum sp. LN27]
MAETVLVVGAHPDDEVLGPGGTLSKHADKGDEVHVLIITEGATTQYEDEALVKQKRADARSCAAKLGLKEVHFGGLTDMKLDTTAHIEVNAVIEEVIEAITPDVIYTHSPHEVNKDHVAVYESTLVAARPESGVDRVYAYETPSSTEWTGGCRRQFSPDRYVDISGYVDTKIEAFLEYDMEVREFPHPRSEQAIQARATTRGTESGFKAAEAFSLVVARDSKI